MNKSAVGNTGSVEDSTHFAKVVQVFSDSLFPVFEVPSPRFARAAMLGRGSLRRQ